MICNECETVAHCTKHGCIPKVSVNEAMKLALEALQEVYWSSRSAKHDEAITALREALAKPAQPKYRRGDRLICLETEEYCVIHISGTDRQWVKFPTSYIGVYTNEQVAELFELLPKEPAQRKQLTTQEIREWWASENGLEDCKMSKMDDFEKVVHAVEAKHGIKEKTND